MPRPTSTHEQRESVRQLAMVVGVREAARKLGLSEPRVQSWSLRYNWNPPSRPGNPASKGPTVIQDCIQVASNGADALRNELDELGRTTKRHLAMSAGKAATTFSEMDGAKVIDKSDRLMNITKVASTIHGWQDTQATSALNLNVLSGGRAIVQVNEKPEANKTSE